VVTRRALLGAGAVALVAGCGPPEEPEIVPSEVLSDQLRVSSEALAAYEGVDDVGPERGFAVARVRQLAAAVRSAGGTVEPGRVAPRTGLEEALAGERRALEAHVAAIGLLGEREWREMFGEFIAGSARNEASLRTKLGRQPLETAFPGQADA
jgi:hypothetical protein